MDKDKALAKEFVYLIIPVFNRKQTTLTCLQTLQDNGDLQKYHVIIVDDNSNDGTAEAIATFYPDATVLPGSGDLWWTGAIALGMQYAYDQGAEYIFWLNDDCLPQPSAISLMVQFMKAHPDAIVAPGCYDVEQQSSTPTKNGFRGRKIFAAVPGEIIPVDGMSGWCVGMPASVVNKIGTPDTTKYPHYAGDDMYLLKATRSGFKAYLLGDAKANLFGKVRVTLNFQNYFSPKSTFAESFQRLFLSKKSPYRLPTQFFRHTERYGYFLGSLLFLPKVVLWLLNWIMYQLKNIFLRKDVVTANTSN